MKIFEFDSYKTFVNERIASLPGNGRGQYRKLAQHLKVHTSLVSQVFRGDKELSIEQGFATSRYFQLDEDETEYFLCSVSKERSSERQLRTYYEKRLAQMRAKWQRPSGRVRSQSVLSEEDHAEFYSDWYVSAVRLLTSIEGYKQIDAIAERLALPAPLVAKVIDFLLTRGLCEQTEDGLRLRVQRTHLEADSRFAARHHLNWRLKALEKIPRQKEPYISFTSPFTASLADRECLRRLTTEFIGKFSAIVDPSPAEQLYCLNLDWFEV